jgi:hypothetical protein
MLNLELIKNKSNTIIIQSNAHIHSLIPIKKQSPSESHITTQNN